MARRIKQLFLSYSRDDKHWTYEFAKALREHLTYSAFVDYRNIHIGADWWRTICEHIEACDCAIYVMTPKSVESLYCRAEIDYLLALNKPILPIMLKPCAFPDELARKRVQYLTISDEMQIDRVLLELQKGLVEIQHLLYNGEYNAPTPLPVRPDEPKPKDTKSAEEVFDLAAEAAEEGQLEQAEGLFTEVIKADSTGGLGRRAQHRLEELRSYLQVVRRAARPATLRDARELWSEYCDSHGRDFDPLKLADKLGIPGQHPVKSIPRPETPAPEILSVSRPRPVRSTSLDLMPPPFAWIDILGKGYSIAKYPITNAQFAVFKDDGGYRNRDWWLPQGWEERTAKKWKHPRFWHDPKWNQSTLPVVGISWFEAVAFSRWLGRQLNERIALPSEEQWQYAAQSDDSRDFPWGGQWSSDCCNSSKGYANWGQTSSVRHYEHIGDSPFGVVDMLGNVWEWCMEQNTDKKPLKGGCWRSKILDIQKRTERRPVLSSNMWGFRLVKYDT